MHAATPGLEQLYADFTALNMEGGWHRARPALWPEPRANFEPHQWRYAQVKPLLDRAGGLVGTDKAERRNLTLTNPVAGNVYPTVRTLVAAYQMIKPGEVARAHRHTPNALRLILDGRGTSTVVDGVRVDMRPGDVLLTPGWTWHSHANEGSECCYWMDFLDVPLVHLLEPMFYEPHPQGIEPDPVYHEASPIAFRWADSLARLASAEAVATADAHRSIQLGDPALRSIALHMQQLDAGRALPTHRTTANAIFAVVEGSGESTIDGHHFSWHRGDTLCVPSWRPYTHRSPEGATLLKVTDSPLLAALGWLRSQTVSI